MAWAVIQGQPLALRILQTHLHQQQIPPAYLFVGPDGVGKRLTAVELAKALNCERPGDPCDRCAQCQRVIRQAHPDLHLLTPKGALGVIHIEEVRQVRERIALRPFMGRYQVVIIDGADRLTEEAANGLLKSLEEPPSQSRFMLLTSQPSRCLPTIVSRCQAIRFHRLPASLLEAWLVREPVRDARTAATISRLAKGSGARAKELAEQWHGYEKMVESLTSDRPLKWQGWTMPTNREEVAQWLTGSIDWLRDLAVGAVADESLLAHREHAAHLRRQARYVEPDRCADAALRMIELLMSLQEQLVSTRLVGTLLREEWIELAGRAPLPSS